jgi:hypothetical protein
MYVGWQECECRGFGLKSSFFEPNETVKRPTEGFAMKNAGDEKMSCCSRLLQDISDAVRGVGQAHNPTGSDKDVVRLLGSHCGITWTRLRI